MATIITINSADKLEPDSRQNINTNFTNLNNELVTKLPLAGGTMQGDLNMGGYKITNLPAPVNNADAARKSDTVPGAGSITGTMIATGAVTNTKLGDDAVTAPKISHDNNRTKILIPVTFPILPAFGTINGTITSASLGLPIARAGSITGYSYSDSGGTENHESFSYGTHPFVAGSRITAYASGTGDLLIKVNGNNAITTTVDGLVDPTNMTIEIELDD